jgi:hypothetical protein
MQVFLVMGPGAPRVLSNVTFVFVPRGILEVVSLESDMASVLEGNELRVTVHVRNVGHANVSSGVVDLLSDGTVVANRSLEEIRPSEERSVTFTWKATSPGLHALSARPRGGGTAVEPLIVEVGGKAPAAGPLLIALAIGLTLLITRVGWRSSRAGRA